MAVTKINKNNELSVFEQDKHLYEVYNDKGIRVFFTDSPEALDEESKLKDLIESDHKIKINGKAISKTKVVAEVKKIRK